MPKCSMEELRILLSQPAAVSLSRLLEMEVYGCLSRHLPQSAFFVHPPLRQGKKNHRTKSVCEYVLCVLL